MKKKSLLSTFCTLLVMSQPTIAGDINWNGYFSSGVATMLNDDSIYLYEITNTPNLERYTEMGIQLSAKVNDDISFVGQLSTDGQSNFEINADWAFLRYQLTDRTYMRAGRMRVPLYNLSDHLNVGYAYLNAVAPRAVYGVIPFENITGIDFSHHFLVNDIRSTAQLTIGSSRPKFDILGKPTQMALDSAVTASVRVEKGPFDFRLAAAHADIKFVGNNPYGDITDGLTAGYMAGDGVISDDEQAQIDSIDGTLTKTATFYSIAMNYNKGSWSYSQEHVWLLVDGGIPDNRAYYATLGYSMDTLTPYVSFSLNASIDDHQRQFSLPSDGTGQAIVSAVNNSTSMQLNTEEQTITVGVRYDFSSRTALKAEIQQIKLLDEVTGTLSEYESDPVYLSLITLNLTF